MRPIGTFWSTSFSLKNVSWMSAMLASNNAAVRIGRAPFDVLIMPTSFTSFHYESVVFNPDVLERLADKVEASHIMLGTDYPFGEWKPVEFVQSATRIPEALRRDILGANAARFLGVDI